MAVDEATVAKIARLARIAVPEDQHANIAQELSHILNWVERLNEVDTEGITPMTSVVDMRSFQRTDRVTEGKQTEDILTNAPRRQNNLFVVPKVLE